MDIGKILRFAWHLDGKIAGSARPGRYGVPSRDFAYLREQGIRHIINLCEDALDVPPEFNEAFDVHHVPVVDGHAPTAEDLAHIRGMVNHAIAHEEPILIHCMGGVGRTATVIAPLLMELGGMTLEQAMANLRESARMTQSMEQWNFLQGLHGQ